MDSNLNTQGAVEREKKRSGNLKRKAFKRCMAVLLSAALTAGSCLPALAAEPQTEGQQEMSGAAMSSAEQDPEEEPALDSAEADQEENADEGSAEGSKEAEETDAANEISETDEKQVEEEQSADSASSGETQEPAEAADTEQPEEAESVRGASGETEETAEPDSTEDAEQTEPAGGADLLTSGETSEWLQNYEYYIDVLSDGTEVVRLSIYNGADTEIVVPGTAVIEGTEYPVTAYNFNIWSNTAERITFDTGFIFENGNSYFSGAHSLKYVDLSRADLSRVTDMEWMFYECESLEEVVLGNADVSNVVNTHSMFYSCSQLSEIDMSAFFSNNVVNFVDNMFGECHSLRELNLSGWDWTNVGYCNGLLTNCNNLEEFLTPYTNGQLDLSLPFRMEDSDSNVYDSFNLLNYSITLTRFEIPEWLNDYNYGLDTEDRIVYLNQYNGDASELTVPCAATIGSNEYRIYFSFGTWGEGVTSITLGEGEYTGDSNPFYYAKDLEYLDLSRVHFQYEWIARDMLYDCGKLNTICTPANLEIDMYLPKLFKDDDGNTYSMLPRGLSESTTLHSADVSEWLEDYAY